MTNEPEAHMAQSKEDSPPGELTSHESAEVLKRILEAVEKKERKPWIEILCVILLSLATVSSAWCTYQSTLWRSVQTFRIAAANQAGRKGMTATIKALQARAFDASMFVQYLVAKDQGNTRLEKLLLDRFRPEMKKAVEAWLKTNPLGNPSAPLTPFRMADYVQPEMKEVEQLEESAAKIRAEMEEANQIANNYVLHTVLFASVLFLGGIAGMMQTRRLRMTILLIALVLFCFTAYSLASMPIGHH